MGPGPNDRGLSRKHVLASIDASLRRLGTDYVDIYQIHRWDYGTPVEETMEALHDVVRAGKARYLGASSMYAWQFAKAQHTAQAAGWTRFSSMQNHYNLVYREEEREMLPLCLDQGVGVIPWSPLARGLLAGSRSRDDAGPRATTRQAATRWPARCTTRDDSTWWMRCGRWPPGVACPRAGCPGLAAAPARGQRPDRRCDPAGSPGGRDRRGGRDHVRGGGGPAGGAVSPAPHPGALMSRSVRRKIVRERFVPQVK